MQLLLGAHKCGTLLKAQFTELSRNLLKRTEENQERNVGTVRRPDRDSNTAPL